MCEVTDDSGFLALIDPDAYVGYVGEDWTLDRLIAHFRAEMEHRRLLIWGTGLEGFWRVAISTGRTGGDAFREVSGPIVVSSGRLLLTNYESLTMAAQFANVSLPEEHDRDLLFPIPSGTHTCRIRQMFDPEEDSSAEGDGPDFAIEILDGEQVPLVWAEIPWSEA